MNWEDIKSKKWKLITIIVVLFFLVGYLYYVYLPAHPSPRPMRELPEPTKSLNNNIYETNFIEVFNENPEDIQIVLERHRCFGTCPSYYFIIFGDGQAYLYNDPPSKDLSVGFVNKEDIVFLLEEFEKKRYFRFKDMYDIPITDLGATSTGLKLGDDYKYIYNYAQAGPHSLEKLEELIDSVKAKTDFEKIKLTKEECDKMYSNKFYFLGTDWSKQSLDYCYYAVENIYDKSEITDIKLCEKFKEDYKKTTCMKDHAEKEEDCGRLTSTSLKDECYFYLAEKLKNPAICVGIQTEQINSRRDCVSKSTESVEQCKEMEECSWMDLCYERWAINHTLPEYCEKAGEYMENCYTDVSVELNSLELCEKAGSKKYNCYYGIAQNLGDISLCEKADRRKNACYIMIAGKLNDASLCENAIKGKDGCYSAIAQNLGDSSLCYKIEDPEDKGYRGFCLRIIAENSGNLSLCYEIERTGQKDLCLIKFAKDLDDSSLCSDIEDEGYRDSCLEYTEK